MAFVSETSQLTREDVLNKAAALAREQGITKYVIVVNGTEYNSEVEMPQTFPADSNVEVLRYTKGA